MALLTNFQKKLFLSEADKQEGFWVQDDVHLAHVISPLFASFMLPAMTHGTKKAFDNMKMPYTQFLMKYSDGRAYQATPPYPGDVESRIAEHQQIAQQRLPIMNDILFQYVDQEFLPFYQKLDKARRSPLSIEKSLEKVKELHAFYERAWELHFEIVGPRASLCMALETLYGQISGEANTTVVYDWLTGVMNKTLETDREMWTLAEHLKSSPELTAQLIETPTNRWMTVLNGSEAGQAFLAKLDLFLEVYGYRTANSHEFLDETWLENPKDVLTTLSEYLQKDYDFQAEFERVIAEREAKWKQALSNLPESEGKAVFAQIYQWALDSWGLDEDHHFYIDAMLPAKSRLFLLEVGKLLVEETVISDPGDIFFLYYDELLLALEAPFPCIELVEQRKAIHEENKKKKVPPYYGEPPAGMENDPVLSRVFGTRAPDVSEEKQSFTGYGASQGTVKGVVKVVKGPEEFDKVKQGDILVCKTTTPPWTVLFSIAGAIITDAGGILSHAATVAREYRIPAVVGSKVSTSLLKDGDLVTVDGTNGVVYFGKS